MKQLSAVCRLFHKKFRHLFYDHYFAKSAKRWLEPLLSRRLTTNHDQYYYLAATEDDSFAITLDLFKNGFEPGTEYALPERIRFTINVHQFARPSEADWSMLPRLNKRQSGRLGLFDDDDYDDWYDSPQRPCHSTGGAVLLNPVRPHMPADALFPEWFNKNCATFNVFPYKRFIHFDHSIRSDYKHMLGLVKQIRKRLRGMVINNDWLDQITFAIKPQTTNKFWSAEMLHECHVDGLLCQCDCYFKRACLINATIRLINERNDSVG